MLVPKILVLNVANILFASIEAIISFRAAKIRNVVEEVKRKNDHGCDNPFKREDWEEEILVSVLAADSLQQRLDLVLLLLL